MIGTATKHNPLILYDCLAAHALFCTSVFFPVSYSVTSHSHPHFHSHSHSHFLIPYDVHFLSLQNITIFQS